MKNLAKKLKKLLNNDAIQDIILFGSASKGKINPNDVDIAILLKKEMPDIKKITKECIPNADVQIIGPYDIYNKLFLTMIKEGFSVKKNSYLHDLYNIKPVKLYKYNLKQLTPSKKVMFERAIKSIGNIKRLSNSVILVPIEHSGQFEEFLRHWQLDIETEEYELLPLMRKDN